MAKKNIIDDINDNDYLISFKRGIIQSIMSMIMFAAIQANIPMKENTAIAISVLMISGIYKLLRRKGLPKLLS